ncbi:MAG: co-chaperone GroES [Patescibacteria group bacterium]
MLKPLGDKVLIEPTLAEEKTKSGIIIPDTAKEAKAEGKVVALGTGKLPEGKKHEFSVKIGDKVLYGKYSGDEVKIDGKEYKVMKEDEILGIF